MSDRQNIVNDELQCTSRSCLQQQLRAERPHLDECEESRVSTDSDPDLDFEDEDDYRSTFSGLLMRKLVAIELIQQQRTLQEDKLVGGTSLQLLTAAEDSYCAKMRRVSQWRESTLQSETQSEEAVSDYSSLSRISRKRSLSDASLPDDSKRARVTTLSPALPGSPFFPRARVCPVDQPSDLSAYASLVRAQLRAQLSAQPYPSLGALHVCSACDTSFTSRQRLRRHGHGAWTPDACRAAVIYGLESD